MKFEINDLVVSNKDLSNAGGKFPAGTIFIVYEVTDSYVDFIENYDKKRRIWMTYGSAARDFHPLHKEFNDNLEKLLNESDD